MSEEMKKRTWVEVDLGQIRENYRILKKRLPEGCRMLGVVKADAYGHGAVPVARILEEEGASFLAVACLEEAMELRKAGIRLPVLILGISDPGDTVFFAEENVSVTVTSRKEAEAFSEQAQKAGKVLKIHIKADTGMGRLGFPAAACGAEKTAAEIAAACALPGLFPEGIFTHFAVSDEEGEENAAYTREQFALFLCLTEILEEKYGISFALRHCANSGAVLSYPETALDMVRPGLLLYGYGDQGRLGVKPCMSLKTRVAAIREYPAGLSVSYGRRYRTAEETEVAVLPLGYGDGLFRSLSGKAVFYSEKGLLSQIGTICMDMCMAAPVKPDRGMKDPENGKKEEGVLLQKGDVVEIFGEHQSLEELSREAGTIPYELLCSVSKRVPRIYRENGKSADA